MQELAERLPVAGNIGQFQYRFGGPVSVNDLPMVAIVWRYLSDGKWDFPSAVGGHPQEAGRYFVREVLRHEQMGHLGDVHFATELSHLDSIVSRLESV